LLKWKAKKATLFFELFLAKTSTVQSVVEENCDTSSNVGAQQNGLKAFGTQKEGRHGLARLLARRPENTAAPPKNTTYFRQKAAAAAVHRRAAADVAVAAAAVAEDFAVVVDVGPVVLETSTDCRLRW
jgi:hypothetical protein